MAQSHTNFAYSTVLTAPSPNKDGTSLVVQSGNGALFPTPPFNATIWPAGEQPTSTNAEIVCVTAVSTDTLTIGRAKEGSTPRYVLVGDQIAATITAKTLAEAENVGSTWSPFIMGSSAAMSYQTLASITGSGTTGSVFVFPVTVQKNIQFNQIIVPHSLSAISSNNTLQASYSYKFGLYSMNANTLSLISSNSFSIGETHNTSSISWNYPATTHTSGYGYGNFPSGPIWQATSQYTAYVQGTRAIGLQFGGNIRLSMGVYWLGILTLRSNANLSTFGISNAGIIGQAINAYNSVGSISGALPLGYAGSQWTNINTHSSGWYGRHILGFVSATSITNQLGTAIPPAITLSALGAVAAASYGTILPSITFVST